MQKVKLHPNCHTRHRPPNLPWYLNKEGTGLAEELERFEWLVTEYPGNKDVFQVVGFYLDGSLMQYKKGCLIQKKDCIGFNKFL